MSRRRLAHCYIVTKVLGLVLGGGGLAGIAWETGVLQGIADENPAAAEALLACDVMVGTSAGATVAAQISSRTPLTELFARQSGDEHNELDPGVAVEELAGLFLAAVGTPGLTKTQKLRRIGEIALATRTVPEPKRRAVIAGRLSCHDWPERTLRITAVDVATGELVVFDRDSGVGLVDAVAASCAVPGVWPPVTIAARRYMDGGVNSTVNIGIAADCDRVVVLVPTPRNVPSPFGNAAEEIEAFPSPTLAIFADDASLAAFGRNPMDPGCRIPSAAAGRTQGRGVAAAVAEFLAV